MEIWHPRYPQPTENLSPQGAPCGSHHPAQRPDSELHPRHCRPPSEGPCRGELQPPCLRSEPSQASAAYLPLCAWPSCWLFRPPREPERTLSPPAARLCLAAETFFPPFLGCPKRSRGRSQDPHLLVLTDLPTWGKSGPRSCPDTGRS